MEEEIKNKLVQYQHISEQLQQFSGFYHELTGKLAEISAILEALDEIKNTSLKKKLLVPVAPGIFLQTELKENSEVVVNVGANVCVKKTIDDTKVLLRKRLSEVEKHHTEVGIAVQQLNEMETQLSQELEQYV